MEDLGTSAAGRGLFVRDEGFTHVLKIILQAQQVDWFLPARYDVSRSQRFYCYRVRGVALARHSQVTQCSDLNFFFFSHNPS